MKAMSYNLLYGAYANADQDGVVTEWSLYKDANHQTREVLQLPAGWASSIYLMDPSNEQWRAYLSKQEDSAFQAFAFDGWQIDQLGDWGTMYNYAGQPVVVSNSFRSFIQEAKSYLNKAMVMNAVNQYGQSNIAEAPVDFLYSEVWDPSVNYSDLTLFINKNYAFSGGRCNTVLAAYMDYNLGNNPGWFSTPGVLMTDAIIFASGGAHIELGEHMLCKEYFPNGNLLMTNELKQDLVHYYDFLTAYENLLRDSVQVTSLQSLTSSGVPISSVQQLGTVWYFAKQKDNLQILQLLNYVNANSLQWRDPNGTQAEPDTIRNVPLSFSTKGVVKRVWMASPDFYGGAAVDLSFTQDSSKVSFTLPQMKYWDMVVIEYDSALTSIMNRSSRAPLGYNLDQNYPNPFNPSTTISFNLKEVSAVKIDIYNVLGQRVLESDVGRKVAGSYSIAFNMGSYTSSVYFYRLDAIGIDGEEFTSTKKMLLIK
jgi:dextranase